jgi:hypothetical protein
MTSDLAENVRPVTASAAANLLGRATATMRKWAERYGARQLGKEGRVVWYDFNDLAVIEREIRHGHKIPPTWEERAAIRPRCPLSTGTTAAA